MSEALKELSPVQIVESLGADAKKAASVLAQTSTQVINDVLDTLYKKLIENAPSIIEANSKDIAAAEQKGLNAALIDRLRLNEDRIRGIAQGVKTVRDLEDPTSKTLWVQERPNGLLIRRVSCPIGVLGMIYESRPNVTVDASILCLKSHNAVILRGGSESLHSSLALHQIIQDALEENNLPKACVSMIPTSDREAVGAMLRASQYIDVMIPRGGHGLIERVMNEARMPVFGHLDGLCHIYIHDSAKQDIALDVTLNAKMRRTGICGAMETLLIDRAYGEDNAKRVLQNILESGCEIVGDADVQKLDSRIGSAQADDWTTEYLDAKLSCKFVDSVQDAVEHINHYGSHHTDSILAEDEDAATYFLQNVDSGIVMHNASTQFADGGEFGMGAEIGIATGKMHARGPVGLEQLCTYKYMVHGNGQTRPKQQKRPDKSMSLFSEPRLLNSQRWKNMRVGILGGSFNPPHEGHVHISKMALKAFELDAVWWLVTPLNPLKTRDNLLSVDERVQLSRDINDHPKIIVSGMEEGFDTTYSYASVKILKRNFPNTQFAWITGMDNAHNFHLWNHWKRFLNEMCMIHVTRHPPVRLMKQCPLRMLSTQKHIIVDHGGRLPLDSNTSYWLLQKKMINISSTEIRQKNAEKTAT